MAVGSSDSVEIERKGSFCPLHNLGLYLQIYCELWKSDMLGSVLVESKENHGRNWVAPEFHVILWMMGAFLYISAWYWCVEIWHMKLNRSVFVDSLVAFL